MPRLLVDEFGGEVPDSREALVRLPGVGRKTANVVLNCWFGQETFAVDTHILRVGNRTGLAKGKTPDHVEAKLDKRVPQPFRLHAHHWLILHGRYICKARTPECWRCPVVDLCSFRKKVLEKPKGVKGCCYGSAKCFEPKGSIRRRIVASHFYVLRWRMVFGRNDVGIVTM